MTSPDTEARAAPDRAAHLARRSVRACLTAAAVVLVGIGCSSGGRLIGGRTGQLPSGVLADCLVQAHCYSPLAFRTAYGVEPLVDRGLDGRGQSVVLIEFSQPVPQATNLREDLARYDARFGLPPVSVRVVTALAKPADPWMAGGEEVEDAEMVHAVAPGAAIRVLYVNVTPGSTTGQLASALDAGVRLGLSQGTVISISASFGENCFTAAQVAGVNSALQAAEDHQVTVVASSGDYGVVGKPCGSRPFIPVKQVGLPASDPLVLAVGGTKLIANPTTGAYLGETAWNNGEVPNQPPGASGGGFSHLFPRPAYQAGVPGITSGRGVPDVAADAGPGTGLALLASQSTTTSYIVPASGTSAGAPFWAALIAIADQDAGCSLGFVNPALYRIGMSADYHRAFHDITHGTNTVTFSSGTFTGYQAAAGWDPVTGWGSPNAQSLIPLLVRDVTHPAVGGGAACTSSPKTGSP
jgi:subtilase family serine protease